MKNSRSHHMLMGLLLALVPASGVQAQSVGPDYTVPPSIEYGPLFRDVQLRAIFPDSKTFPDLIPHGTPQSILRNYATARHAPDFDLARFVNTNFSGPVPPGPAVSPAGHGETLATYVASLWPVLTEIQQRASIRDFAAAALSLRRARRALPRGLLLGFLLHHARARAERQAYPRC